MSPVVRRAAPAAVLCAVAVATGTAHAQSQPEPQPPLTTRPPVPLPRAAAAPAATATPVPAATPAGTPEGAQLPRTGQDAGLVALAGASMLGMGLSLRRLAAHGGH